MNQVIAVLFLAIFFDKIVLICMNWQFLNQYQIVSSQ